MDVSSDRRMGPCSCSEGCTWGTRAGSGRYVGHTRREREVRGVRAPGACRVRASAHRLSQMRPCRGLIYRCFLRMLARGIAGRFETARAPRRFGPDGLRASVSPTPACSSPDRGAGRIAGGRRRGRDKPPARVPHVHPLAACTTRHTSIEWHRQDGVNPQAKGKVSVATPK